MIFRNFIVALGWRVLLLTISVFGLTYGILENRVYFIVTGSLVFLFAFFGLFRFMRRYFREVNDFFEAVKYRDFSTWFSENHGSNERRQLHRGFNLINKTIKRINSERQAQYLYLQKILEMVDVGIIAFEQRSGDVLWVNESFLNLVDFPRFKNISFVKSRREEQYNRLFLATHNQANPITLNIREETIKVLVSDSIFKIDDSSIKLIVVQNVEATLNKTEDEAWKKLLSVMTHEIMNSIAPISSLADTLHNSIEANIEHPKEQHLDLEDINSGILSIKKRSEGLMKFAQTYRSLNKKTQLILSEVSSKELFQNIESLMAPTLQQKGIAISFKSPQPDILFNIDIYLMEQVLINLILNAMESFETVEEAKISISAERLSTGNNVIKVFDNGKGIPNEIIENIFVPFFSSKKTGSGIGLSLCKQIMTLHNGKIQVKSIVGKGTVFRLIFKPHTISY